ncbi:hypothetical protein BOTBODRAFT_35726 [Botryobasidium botryosum FD-172 SS1]|uniref:SnoaL-like domain-containing protein n=1 Tax=Botryobasidium botryosum (strain FD-172 SS1) TaxID=930990 RepID=A0A067M5A9_BOTB1|nr:hypothetical protein BOTBODRAFT_35726 [Botryobasidium botryosum FD-172 SS1]
MSAFRENASPRLQAALDWLHAFDKRDIAALNNIVTDSFTHQTLPISLGQEVVGKEAFSKHVEGLSAQFADFETTETDVIEGPQKIFILAKSTSTSKSGAPFTHEYGVIFSFDGEKISSIKEYVDSLYIQRFFTAEQLA